MRALSKGAGKREHPAKGTSFSLASQTQRFCLGTVLVTCLLVPSALRKPEPLCLLTKWEQREVMVELKTQELIVINCKQLRCHLRGGGQRFVRPNP